MRKLFNVTLVVFAFLLPISFIGCTKKENTCDNCNSCKICKCTKCVDCKCCCDKDCADKHSKKERLDSFGKFQAGGPELNGETISCDLPNAEHLHNKGGSDGAGLCVFTSIEHAARWCNEPSLIGFRDFMTRFSGGGWPEKVDQMIPKMAQSKGLPAPNYIQHEGGDPEFLRLALKTGRYVSVTYAGQDGIFYNQGIDHMVNLVHLTEKTAVILDNNNPGKYLWMDYSDFITRWKARGGGWAVVLLKPGPPPIPVNWKKVKDYGYLAGVTWGYDEGSYIRKKGDRPLLGIDEDGKEVFRGPKLQPVAPGPKDPKEPSPVKPKPEPVPEPKPSEKEEDFGVNRKLIKNATSYKMNGNEITKEQALKVMEGKLVDDSKLYRLTINIADSAIRTRVECDIRTNPALASWRDKVLVQSYEPTHWAVANIGHKPGIILQPPADSQGKAPVILRIPEYKGPEHLAEALRLADQNYNPNSDPNGSSTPDLTSLLKDFDLSKIPTWLYGVLGFLGYVFYKNKTQNNKG